ncbi:MAG: lipid-A-disaccharide synthase [Cyanobacteria bacterium P01_H01_bin.130]
MAAQARVQDRVQDILILSNGPGEVSTWVRPVVRSLRQIWASHPAAPPLRISVVLSPCSHAMGTEKRMVETFPEVDRVQGPEDFWRFLLWGKTAAGWDWSDRGLVLFLGGDQFFPVVVGRRLGYRILTYGEREVRWLPWIDGAAIAHRSVAPSEDQPNKIRWVGDLMVDAAQTPLSDAVTAESLGDRLPDSAPEGDPEAVEWVGLLPGSKAAKLMQGVPLLLATAAVLERSRPNVRCIIPVAPTLSLTELACYGDRAHNPILENLGNLAARLVIPEGDAKLPYLETETGGRVYLWQRSPAYDLLQHCAVCLTTVGANTAELGALAVPMVVILPTQQLDAMRAWDGIPGLLAQLPGVGPLIARLINQQAIKRLGLLSWPNIWAQEAIVPELVGKLTPEDLAAALVPWLVDRDKNQAVRDRLRAVCGQAGASEKIARWSYELLGEK